MQILVNRPEVSAFAMNSEGAMPVTAEYKGYRIAPVNYISVVGQAAFLHKQHWDEVCTFGSPYSEGEFRPCLEPYFRDDFVFYVAMKGNELAGYAGFFLVRSTRTSEVTAIEDLFFVAPQHRIGRLAQSITGVAEANLKAIGVSSIVATCPIGSPAAKVWQQLGYRKSTEQFVKEI